MSVVFEGEQLLANADHAKTILLSEIQPDQEVVVDLAGLTRADLSFVQTLEAARRQAEACGAELRLAAPAPEALREVLELGGFPLVDSHGEPNFWTNGAQTS